MAAPLTPLGHIGKQIQDAITDYYFILRSGRSVYVNVTYFIEERFNGGALINNLCRRLPVVYLGLAWAPHRVGDHVYIVLLASDLALFAKGFQDKTDALNPKLPLHPDSELQLFSVQDNFRSAIMDEPSHCKMQWHVSSTYSIADVLCHNNLSVRGQKTIVWGDMFH